MAALLMASLFGLLTSFGVARSGGDPAWGWMGFAFSLILNWGAALERRLKDRRAARPRPPPPLGWRRVPWYSWFFLACAAFPLLAVTAFLDERRLAREGVVTHAAVTDWREHPGRRGTTFEVRYAFRVSPGGEEFTASTSFPFPQRDLWVELPRDAWDQTRTTPTLEVRYVPGAPQINRAEAGEPESMLAVLLFAPFGLALAVLLVTASWRGWIAPD